MERLKMMRKKHNPLIMGKLVFLGVGLLLSLGFLTGVLAQSSTVGNISGTVRDPNGAALPKAEVTIQEENTGYVRKVTTNEEGFFSAQSLPVGRYVVSTAPQGFKKIVNSGLELHVNENLVVNLTLAVGQVTETVNVQADAVQVETRSGDVSSLIGEKQVTELPLNGRNYAQLVLMVPGVSPATGGVGGAAFSATGTGLDAGVDLSVNGNGSDHNLR